MGTDANPSWGMIMPRVKYGVDITKDSCHAILQASPALKQAFTDNKAGTRAFAKKVHQFYTNIYLPVNKERMPAACKQSKRMQLLLTPMLDSNRKVQMPNVLSSVEKESSKCQITPYSYCKTAVRIFQIGHHSAATATATATNTYSTTTNLNIFSHMHALQ